MEDNFHCALTPMVDLPGLVEYVDSTAKGKGARLFQSSWRLLLPVLILEAAHQILALKRRCSF